MIFPGGMGGEVEELGGRMIDEMRVYSREDNVYFDRVDLARFEKVKDD